MSNFKIPLVLEGLFLLKLTIDSMISYNFVKLKGIFAAKIIFFVYRMSPW